MWHAPTDSGPLQTRNLISAPFDDLPPRLSRGFTVCSPVLVARWFPEEDGVIGTGRRTRGRWLRRMLRQLVAVLRATLA